MPDRVLFISPQPFFEWRGSPIRVLFDVMALSELGYEVDLLTLPMGSDHDVAGVNLLRVANPLGLRHVPIGPSASKLFFDLLLLLAGFRRVRRNRYAVIHGIEEAGVLACVLSRPGRTAAVFEKHSDPASHRGGALRNAVLGAYACVERWTMRRADAVIGTGAGLAEQARNAGARAVHPIPDIPSSLVQPQPARAAGWRRKLLPPDKDVLIMYVGSFAAYQGVSLLFEAVPRVLAGHPSAQFVVVGGSEREIASRRRELAAARCPDAVSFADRIHPDELPHFLAAADILLSPRLSGVNTPLKLLDYMKAGAAIVATDSDANRLILDDGTAFLTKPSADAFAEGVLLAIRDPDARRRHVERGRALIESTYNFDVFRNSLAECYRAIRSERNGAARGGSA